MKRKITDLTHYDGERGLRWTYDGHTIERRFRNPVNAVEFQDGEGLLVVELSNDEAPDNAIIINCDGSIRIRIKNPEAQNGAICFGDAYYVNDELTLIICFSSWQMACVIDENGNVVRTYETR